MVAINTPVAPGFDAVTLAAMYHGHIIENHRFPDRGQRALSVAGDEHDSYFPDADELASRGFNIAHLAIALQHGLIAASVAGDMIAKVDGNAVSLRDANRSFYRMALSASRQENLPLDAVTLRGLGIDVELVNDCLHVGAISPENFGKLMSHVRRGWTSIEDANSGLEHVYDDFMAERRRAA